MFAHRLEAPTCELQNTYLQLRLPLKDGFCIKPGRYFKNNSCLRLRLPFKCKFYRKPGIHKTHTNNKKEGYSYPRLADRQADNPRLLSEELISRRRSWRRAPKWVRLDSTRKRSAKNVCAEKDGGRIDHGGLRRRQQEQLAV